jgi:hypothetical protein
MVLHWDKKKYQRVDGAVSVFLLATIGGFMSAWHFEVIPGNMLFVAILPLGLAHWYKRKLKKLLKTYAGAQVAVENDKLILLKPHQDYEATIRFREIWKVESTRWLFLDKMKLFLRGNREIELVNFRDQKSILSKLNTL